MKSSDSGVSVRVFLVGCPRSGTTLLQSMLAGHSRVASFPETHFFDLGFGENYRWMKHNVLRGFYFEYLLRKWLRSVPPGAREDLTLRFPTYSRGKAVANMIQTLDELTHRTAKDVWLEKTPGHIRHIETITSVVEGCSFLHLIRDGRAVVASLQDSARRTSPNLWKGFDDVDHCIDWWNQSIEITANYMERPKHLVCSYEHLVENPAAELHRICDFLGIDYEESMLRDRAKTAKRLVTEGETWKNNNLEQEITAIGFAKYMRFYGEQERRHIEGRLNLSAYNSMLRKLQTGATLRLESSSRSDTISNP